MRGHLALSIAGAFTALLVGCSPFGESNVEAEQDCPRPQETFVRQAWVTDAAVEAVAVYCETIFVAGAFETIGKPTGPLASVSARATTSPALPVVRGDRDGAQVTSLLADGKGGWFVGGRFEFMGTRRCGGLGRVFPTGAVDPSLCLTADGALRALAHAGDRLYVGGDFTRIAGLPRLGIAAVDAQSGEVLPWAPKLDERTLCEENRGCVTHASVSAIAVGDSAVYVGGSFNGVDGLDRTHLAALDPVTGAAKPFNAGIRAEEDYFGSVEAVAVTGDVVYASCPYCNATGSDEPLLRLDAESGRRLGPGVSVDEPVRALAPHGSRLYVAGEFGRIAGERRNALAALDAPTGRLLSWTASAIESGASVTAVAPTGGAINVATLDTYEGYSDSSKESTFRITSFDPETGRAHSRGVLADDAVLALGAHADQLVAGGQFTSIGIAKRDGLAAIDGTRGVLLDWAPRTGQDSWEHPNALLVANNRLYVGGSFTRMGAERRHGLAAFELPGRSVADWGPTVRDVGDPFFDGVVTITARDDTIYAGGDFTHIDGTQRIGAAALDGESGELLEWDPEVGVDPTPRIDMGAVSALATRGDRVYVGGEFENVAGTPRNGLAAVDASSGDLESWDPRPVDEWVEALLPSDSGVYVGGWFGEIGDAPRVAIALVDADDGHAAEFDAGLTHGPALAIVMSDQTLFVGGSLSDDDGEVERGLAVFDPLTGAPSPWGVDSTELGCTSDNLAIGGGALIADSSLDGCGDYNPGPDLLLVIPVP